MPFANLCRFPITCYEGEYRPTWIQKWTRVGGAAGSWQFFGYARDMILDNNGVPYSWEGDFGFDGAFRMLAGPRNDWGAFELVGVLQMDSFRNIYKACGSISLRKNDLGFFIAAGNKVREHRSIKGYQMTPDAYCIPGVGGRICLTLVTTNDTRIEVYFLSGRDTKEYRSKLPGMDNFYRAEWMKKLLALFSGVCWKL